MTVLKGAPRESASPLFHWIPFSKHPNGNEIRSSGQHLLEALNIQPEPLIIRGCAEDGLEIEADARRAWWRRGKDPFRAALHRFKREVFARACRQGSSQRLTEAWRRAEQYCRSDQWRERLRRLGGGKPGPEREFFRRAFCAAQQAWSRAIRWHLIMPPEMPNPFLPLVRLYSIGIWPLGCPREQLVLFKHSLNGGRCHPLNKTCAKPPIAGRRKQIFLSVPFRHAGIARLWSQALSSRGWRVKHGPVDEALQAPEQRLGRRLDESQAVIALLPAVDQDFGIPWWSLQEIDFAVWSSKPTCLIVAEDLPPLHESWKDCVVIRAEPLADPSRLQPVWDFLNDLESKGTKNELQQ